MAVARHLGQPVTCVTVTDGDFAPTEAERLRAAGVRRAELDLALDLLGVTDRVRFGLRDGDCHQVADHVGVSPDRRCARVTPTGHRGHIRPRRAHRPPRPSRRLAVDRRCRTPRSSRARLLCPSATPEIVSADRDINDRFDVYGPGLPTTHRVEELLLELTINGPWLDLKLRGASGSCQPDDRADRRRRGRPVPPLDRPRTIHRLRALLIRPVGEHGADLSPQSCWLGRPRRRQDSNDATRSRRCTGNGTPGLRRPARRLDGQRTSLRDALRPAVHGERRKRRSRSATTWISTSRPRRWGSCHRSWSSITSAAGTRLRRR